MANTAPIAKKHDIPTVGESVEVWCSFDHVWHAGFRVHRIEQTETRVSVVLARSDGSVLPTPVDSVRIRPRD